MILVILESPYAGDVEGNIAYARRALSNCLHRGEAPIASHLLYTQPGVLDDDIPAERNLGIEAGLAWRNQASMQVFYTDRGWSRGMLAALIQAVIEKRDFEFRAMDGKVRLPSFNPLHPDMGAITAKDMAAFVEPGKEWITP